MTFLKALFGSGNAIAQTVQVFRPGAEASAQRAADYSQAALAQFASEYSHARRGVFDRFMDGLNRLPRPLMVIATFALFAMAMHDPLWFAERMQGLSLVPEPLWWLMGTIVAFYFGGRFQIKGQEFQREIAKAATRLPDVLQNIETIRALRSDSPGVADTATDSELTVASIEPDENPAIRDWRTTA